MPTDFLANAKPVKDFLDGAKPVKAPPPAPEGFLHSLGSELGLTGLHSSSILDALKDPFVPLNAIYDGAAAGVKRTGDELSQAGSDLASGDKSGAAYHGIKSIPILGPALDKMADQTSTPTPGESYMSQVGDVFNSPGAMGTGVGAALQLAPMLLGGVDAKSPNRPLLGRIPTTAHAGETFSDLSSALDQTPVSVSKSLQPIQRAGQLGIRGRTVPKAVSDLLGRVSGTQGAVPMLYPEARDFQSALSDLSVMDKLNMGGQMRGAIKDIGPALFDDIRAAADTKGLGETYGSAMTEYRRGAKLKSIAKGAGVAGAGLGLKAAGAGGILSFIKKSLEK